MGGRLRDDIAVGVYASIVILISDIAWLVHDIMINGLSGYYIVICIGLFLGWSVLAYSFYLHVYKKTRKVKRKCYRYYSDDSHHCGD